MDIKAQAELRRQKILANAAARLQKLTGKPIENIVTSKALEEVVRPPSVNGIAHSGSARLSSNHLNSILSHEEIMLTNALDDDCPRPPNGLNINNSEPRSETPDLYSGQDSQDLTLFYYFFLTLGLTTRLVVYFGFSVIFLNNVLGPFIVVCIPVLPHVYTGAAEAPGLLSLAGRHHRKFQVILKVISTTRALSQFFALYLFSFVLTHSVLGHTESRWTFK